MGEKERNIYIEIKREKNRTTVQTLTFTEKEMMEVKETKRKRDKQGNIKHQTYFMNTYVHREKERDDGREGKKEKE